MIKMEKLLHPIYVYNEFVGKKFIDDKTTMNNIIKTMKTLIGKTSFDKIVESINTEKYKEVNTTCKDIFKYEQASFYRIEKYQNEYKIILKKIHSICLVISEKNMLLWSIKQTDPEFKNTQEYLVEAYRVLDSILSQVF